MADFNECDVLITVVIDNPNKPNLSIRGVLCGDFFAVVKFELPKKQEVQVGEFIRGYSKNDEFIKTAETIFQTPKQRAENLCKLSNDVFFVAEPIFDDDFASREKIKQLRDIYCELGLALIFLSKEVQPQDESGQILLDTVVRTLRNDVSEAKMDSIEITQHREIVHKPVSSREIKQAVRNIKKDISAYSLAVNSRLSTSKNQTSPAPA